MRCRLPNIKHFSLRGDLVHIVQTKPMYIRAEENHRVIGSPVISPYSMRIPDHQTMLCHRIVSCATDGTPSLEAPLGSGQQKLSSTSLPNGAINASHEVPLSGEHRILSRAAWIPAIGVSRPGNYSPGASAGSLASAALFFGVCPFVISNLQEVRGEIEGGQIPVIWDRH